MKNKLYRFKTARLTSKALQGVFLAGAIVIGAVTSSSAQALWKNAHISAGSGFVTDFVAQPKVPNLFYLRTDVGGFFRWNPITKAWIPISDFITLQHRDLYGGESIAVDSTNPNDVYIACGGGQIGAIYKSTDRGNTWTQLGLKGVVMSGNENMRWGGERLQVQPGNSNILLFGSRSQGLWRTADAGRTWQQTALPFPAKNDDGVQAVAFDPNRPNTAYAAVATKGIFRSDDSGSTWTNISAGIMRPERLTVAQDGTVWVTYNNGVTKFAQGKWTNVTPKGALADAYCGVAISPRNAKKVIVSYGLWGDVAPNAMFMTLNGGATWTRLNETITTDVPWYVKMDPGKKPGQILPFLYTPISNFAFDPNKPYSVWFTSAGGIYHTSDIDRKGGPHFQQVDNGHEELCVTSIATPPTGHELIAGVMDVDGFVFDKGLQTYPTRRFNEGASLAGVTQALAYEEDKPENMVKLAVDNSAWSHPAIVLSSHDGGFVWHEDKSFTGHTKSGAALAPLGLAVSANDPTDVVIAVNNIGDNKLNWLYKKHGMTSWATCAGLPTQPYTQDWAVPLAADSVDGTTFYAYAAGAIYRSRDGGATFRQVSTGTVGAPSEAGFFKLVSRPGISGDLWLSEDNDNCNYLSPNRPSWEGLYHSSDAGRTWTKLPGISRAFVYCFGKAAPRTGHPTLYYYGRQTGDVSERIFRSDNLGKTWTVISHTGQAIGDCPFVMEGSRQTYGRVFIGTSGRGIYYSPSVSAGQ